MSAIKVILPAEDIAELLAHLGGIAPKRVRLRPLPGTATEADVLEAMQAPRKRLCELIDGILVEKVMGIEESVLAGMLISILVDYVRLKNLGLVSVPDGPWRLRQGRVRMPDIAFVSWDRLPGRKRPTKPIPTVAPNLAAEILSRGNTAKEMLKKRHDYFSAGVELVWEIDPRTREVRVFTAAETPEQVLSERDVLRGGRVLPGFSLKLRELFAELDRVG